MCPKHYGYVVNILLMQYGKLNPLSIPVKFA